MLSMEKAKVKAKSGGILKIELNGAGDYVAVSADDSMLFDNFISGYRRIADLADAVPAKLDEIEKKYEGREDFRSMVDKAAEMSGVNVQFSKDATEAIDGIFGDGTVRKYFHDIIEEIPDFLPDVDCIMDFFEQITPEMEKLFNRKIEERDKRSKERMAKYKPQNHGKASAK